MSNTSKKLLESFDSLDSFTLTEDTGDIEKAIKETQPKDNKYFTFDFDISDDEISLMCNGTENIQNFEGDDYPNIDEKAIKAMEAWAKKLAKRIPALKSAVEDEIGSDWFSGMSVFGESGPFTYDGFTMFLYLDEDDEDDSDDRANDDEEDWEANKKEEYRSSVS